MNTSSCVEQKGTIEEIKDGIVKVNLLSISACASCHAKGACSMLDIQNKIIDIYESGKDYKKGEVVNVIMRQSLGYKAMLLAYGLPFLLVLATLIILTSLHVNELIAGLGSLSILIPYYLVIYFFRDNLQKTFTFTIKKLTEK